MALTASALGQVGTVQARGANAEGFSPESQRVL